MKAPLSVLLTISLWLTGCGDGSSNAPLDSPTAKTAPKLPSLVAAIELPGAETQPFAYLKTIALPKLVQKAAMIAQAVKPGPETAAIPAMAGMMIGDPELTSVDPESPITFFVFDDFREGNPAFVIAGKLSEDSPIRKTLDKANLAVIDHDGWTLATMAPELISQIEDWSPLLTFAEKAPEGEIELGVRLDPLWKELPQIKGSIAGGLELAQFEEDLKSSIIKSSSVILDEVAMLDSMKMSVFLSKEEIVGRTSLEAKDSSALGKLFSSETKDGGNSVAKYVKSGGMMDMVVDMDVQSQLEYFEHLIDQIAPLFQGETKELMERYKKQISDIGKLYGGQMAMRYDISNKADEMKIVQIGSTKASSEEFGKLFTDSTKLTQEIFEKIDFFETMGVKYEVKVEQGEPVEGVPTHRFSMKMDSEDADPELFPTGLPYSNMSYLYAVTNGHYVVAMDDEQLGRLIRTVKTGKPVENSLAKTLPLKPGQMARWSLNLGKYAQAIIGAIGGTDESTKQILDDFEQMNLAPITGSFSTGVGRLSADLKVPLKTIKAGAEYFENEQ